MLSRSLVINTNAKLGSPRWPGIAASISRFAPPDGWRGLASPEEVQARVHHSIRYARDRGDEWQTPNHTIARGAGDCEDHAILKLALLGVAGIGASLVICTLRATGEGHALCGIAAPWRFLDVRHATILADDEAGVLYAPRYILDIDRTRLVLEVRARSGEA